MNANSKGIKENEFSMLNHAQDSELHFFKPHPLKTDMEPQIQKTWFLDVIPFLKGTFFSREPAFRPCVKTVGWDSSPGLLGDGQQICHMFLVGGGHFTFNPEVRFLTLTLCVFFCEINSRQ